MSDFGKMATRVQLLEMLLPRAVGKTNGELRTMAHEKIGLGRQAEMGKLLQAPKKTVKKAAKRG